MPDMISIGIGGGTIVRLVEGKLKIGPDSVGHNLVTEAICFGGETLTLTDVAKKLKRTDVGHVDVDNLISDELASKVDEIVNSNKIDVILVGGGSVVVNPKYFKYDILNILLNHDVVNAIGASIIQVSGTHEGIFPMKGKI